MMQRNNGFRWVYVPLALAAWGIYTHLTPQQTLHQQMPVKTYKAKVAIIPPADSTVCTYIFETMDAK
jgi:hypothetical protein